MENYQNWKFTNISLRDVRKLSNFVWNAWELQDQKNLHGSVMLPRDISFNQTSYGFQIYFYFAIQRCPKKNLAWIQ